jgi:hypothetical protein
MSAKIVFAALIVYGALVSAISAEDRECYVDIMPGVCPGVLNITEQGLLPIAILGTQDFNVTIIDPSTVRLMREGSTGIIQPFRWNVSDMATAPLIDSGESCNCYVAVADGYGDLILEFDIYELVQLLELQSLSGDNVVLNLTGTAQNNSTVEGSDCLNVLV